MATTTETRAERRVPLSRERVLQAAIDLADREGIESVTMRKLAEELGVEAMSLYYHIANKEALLDGMVDAIVAEVEGAVGGFGQPPADADWKSVMRDRILGARNVLLRHPWAPGVIETRTTMSPLMMRYFDALLGLLRHGGFSYDLAHHGMHALGSRAFGFTQELFAPDDPDEAEEDAMVMLEQMKDHIPFITEMLMEVSHEESDSTLGWCDDQTEFEFGLDLILDGLDRLRERA